MKMCLAYTNLLLQLNRRSSSKTVVSAKSVVSLTNDSVTWSIHIYFVMTILNRIWCLSGINCRWACHLH